MASEPNPDPAQFKVVRQQLVSKGVTVGASYIEYDVTLQGAQAMMRNSPMDLCALCDTDSQCKDELASRGYGEPDCIRVAETLVIDAIMAVLNTLTVADVTKTPESCDQKGTLINLEKCGCIQQEREFVCQPPRA